MPPIELGTDLGIERAPDLKEALCAQLDSGRSVVLDGSQVERVHGATMQLLTAFFRERDEAGKKTRIESPSPALIDAAGVLALTTALGLPESGDE